MPQMAPMNWILLYPYFILLFYLFIILIYFMKHNNKIETTPQFKNSPTLNWKW